MSVQRVRYDVIIIGARAAGAATALLLARAGLRVLLVDRGAPGDDALSTHALMRPAVLLLERWGVLDAIIEAGTPPIRSTTFHYGDTAMPFALKPRDGIDALYAPRRTVLDPSLVAAARAAGAEVHHHTKLRALMRDGERVRGAVLDQDGKLVVVRADLVIGADGISSTVARGVDAPITRAGTFSTATVYAHVEAQVDGYHWYFRPEAGAGLVPTNGGACMFVVVPTARYHAELRHELVPGFARVLAEAAPSAVGLAAGVTAVRPFAGRAGYVRQAAGPGWALVGDAGFFRDPFTAHGLTDALRDAALLASELASTGSLARYEDARDDFARPILELSDAIASFRWTLDELGALHQRMQREQAREATAIRELTAVRAAGDAVALATSGSPWDPPAILMRS